MLNQAKYGPVDVITGDYLAGTWDIQLYNPSAKHYEVQVLIMDLQR